MCVRVCGFEFLVKITILACMNARALALNGTLNTRSIPCTVRCTLCKHILMSHEQQHSMKLMKCNAALVFEPKSMNLVIITNRYFKFMDSVIDCTQTDKISLRVACFAHEKWSSKLIRIRIHSSHTQTSLSSMHGETIIVLLKRYSK